MKKNRLILTVIMSVYLLSLRAADCHIPLSVASIESGDEVPYATEEIIKTRLQNILTENGEVVGGTDFSRFFIAAKFNHELKDVLSGPPAQTVLVTDLTIYIGDNETKTIFASSTFKLRGVGHSENRALISALRPINANNEKIKNLINGASDKILDYYDNHYGQIIEKASKAAGLHDYAEAVSLIFSIPECCKGYGQAVNKGLSYYQKLIDSDGRKVYEMARAIWLASPNAYGASRALPILFSIPDGSEASKDAEKLVSEIGATVKDDKLFESRTKYKDNIEIKKMNIQAAKEVGTAWGRGQQPKTTNITWLR